MLKYLPILLTYIFFWCNSATMCTAEDYSNPSEQLDNECKENECDTKEKRAWRHHLDEIADEEDPTYRLEDDTAWPGQREEYSDYLLR